MPGLGAPPSDNGDFGRCYRLLQLFPAWKKRLPEMVEKDPRWATLVQDWAKLEALYEKSLKEKNSHNPGNLLAKKLYQEIQQRTRPYTETIKTLTLRAKGCN